MKIAKNGVELIKKWEGFRSAPYLDAVGIPTIGYGATHYGNGIKVKMTDAPITEDQASSLMYFMFPEYEGYVDHLVDNCLNQNQFDALVSFVYNFGPGNFSTSGLLYRVNKNPNDPKIKDEFMKWVKAGGKTLKGLVKRRADEADLYFKLKCD